MQECVLMQPPGACGQQFAMTSIVMSGDALQGHAREAAQLRRRCWTGPTHDQTRSLKFRKGSPCDLLASWLCKLTKFCFYVSELLF